MDRLINVKELRAALPDIVRRVRRGERFTVLYRSRPAFRLVPVAEPDTEGVPLDADPVYKAGPIGRSRDGLCSRDHDRILYGRPRRS